MNNCIYNTLWEVTTHNEIHVGLIKAPLKLRHGLFVISHLFIGDKWVYVPTLISALF